MARRQTAAQTHSDEVRELLEFIGDVVRQMPTSGWPAFRDHIRFTFEVYRHPRNRPLWRRFTGEQWLRRQLEGLGKGKSDDEGTRRGIGPAGGVCAC
jgi:hypothetical protein